MIALIERVAIFGSLLVLLEGCAATAAPIEIVPADVSVRGTNLIYDGEISHEANARLFVLAASNSEKARKLVVTSGGGDVKAGLELGNWILDEGLDVYVPEYCISSCANYVFTAGKRKFLNANALLIWHGGSMQKGLLGDSPCSKIDAWPEQECNEQELREELETLLVRWQELESAFFERIGVDQAITVLGQHPDYDCRDGDGYIGWYYSIPDMEELGVGGISVLAESWRPVAPSPDVKFCRVELDRSWDTDLR